MDAYNDTCVERLLMEVLQFSLARYGMTLS